MDRSASILSNRVRELLAEIRARMHAPSPESLGAFSALGFELGSLRANVMHVLRTDPDLRALAPETHPGHFELRIEDNLEASLASLAAGLDRHGLTQTRPVERLDVRTPGGLIVGRADRSIFRTLGLATVVVRLLAFTSDHRFLLQQRSPAKSIGPGLWDNLAAGLVATGETPVEAMLRELREEAGLAPPPETLLAPSHLRWRVLHNVPEGRMQEATFGFILEIPPGAVPVNLDGEAAGFAAFTADELLLMIERDQLMPEASRLILEHLSHCA